MERRTYAPAPPAYPPRPSSPRIRPARTGTARGGAAVSCRVALRDRITIDPAVCHGRPCVRGLRYPVDMVLDLLSGGMTTSEVLEDYPDLEADDL